MKTKLKDMTKTEAVLYARMNALEWVLIQTGRWTKDSDVALIQLSSDPMDRLIANELMRIAAKLGIS